MIKHRSMMAALLAAAVLSAGCGMTRASQRSPAPVSPLSAPAPEILAPSNGSIWQSSNRNSLFLDNKARNVGDLVTVQVVEQTSVSLNAATALSRETDIQANLNGLFGITGALQNGGLAKLLDVATIKNLLDHDGEGSTSRSGNLSATVSCMVTEVLANGYLRIEGRRDMTVNNENEFIILTGVIRPEDITAANTVVSSQIADARIEYSGDGDVDDHQSPSWLNRLFNAIRIL